MLFILRQKFTRPFDCSHFQLGSEIKEMSQMDNISTCVRCGEKYKDLNSFYKSLESKYSYHACMDVVDMVSIIVPIYISKLLQPATRGGGGSVSGRPPL